MKNERKKNKFDLNIVILLLIIIIAIVIVFLITKKEDEVKPIYSIKIIGETYISINVGEDYNEPGFIAQDQFNNDYTDKVNVTNEINNNIPGMYKVIYQLENAITYRIVEVKQNINKELIIDIIKNEENVTNQDVLINIKVSGETFSSLVLPDGNIVNNKETEFTIKENGTYLVKAINSFNEEFVKEIIVNNIDKEKPTGTCEATITNSNTTVSVSASDNNNKITYNYYDNETLLNSSEENNYTSTNKTSKIISVILKDNAGNEEKINCSITDNSYYEPVPYSTGGKVIYNGSSDTLKVHIESKSSYYLTYIWAKNPYMQLNKFASPEYGKKLYTSSALISMLNEQKNLTQKMVVAFNASGFYLKGRFDSASVEKYAPYDKTSVGTIVINDGQLVRNAYEHADKTWYITGVTKDNKMVYFEDTALGGNVTVESKKAWADTVINSGIRNTFTFAAPLINNGVRTNITTSMPKGNDAKKGLQLICQINDNNFVLFTSNNSTRNIGIDVFLQLGCQTAVNLDGGGSVRLYYKEKGSSSFKSVIIGSDGGRQFPEIGYFTE